jgi:hypothetical protein
MVVVPHFEFDWRRRFDGWDVNVTAAISWYKHVVRTGTDSGLRGLGEPRNQSPPTA